MLRKGLVEVPAKITSSMSDARMFLVEFSPITQRSASSRFDLPQPFGPTTPVKPGSIRSSVGSTKDLKPDSRSRVNFIWPRVDLSGKPTHSPVLRGERRIDQLPELFRRFDPPQHLAIDEEGWR